MGQTILFQDLLNPSKEYVQPAISKITKQIILLNKDNVNIRIDLENKLNRNFSDLPLVFDNLLPNFRVLSHQSLIPFAQFDKVVKLLSDQQGMKKHIQSMEKKLYKDRLGEKISLQKYILSRIYLKKFGELGALATLLYSEIRSKPAAEVFAQTAIFLKAFEAKIEEYNLKLLTFLSLLFLLQEKNLIFKDEIFNKVNLYASDLSRSQQQLVEEIKKASK